MAEFSLVGYHQRVNHFPGSFNFGRKDRLWINLKAKAETYGYEVFGNFHPRTFILPADYSLLLQYWKEVETVTNSEEGQKEQQKFGRHKKVFICKPPASARGQGISIVSTVEELNQLMATTANQPISSGSGGDDQGNKAVMANAKKPKVSCFYFLTFFKAIFF